MRKYLKIVIESQFVGQDITQYIELSDDEVDNESLLVELGQQAVNEAYPWGHDVVDEADVPESER